MKHLSLTLKTRLGPVTLTDPNALVVLLMELDALFLTVFTLLIPLATALVMSNFSSVMIALKVSIATPTSLILIFLMVAFKDA